MSRNYTFVTYRNKVPSSFQRMGCRGFDLEVPIERGYEKAKHKALIVIGKIPTEDLIANKLLGGDSNGLRIMDTLLDESQKWAHKFDTDLTPYKFATINFNFFKNYDLGDEAYRSSLKENAKRVRRYIKKMKPSLIIVFGDEAMTALIRGDENTPKRRGSVVDYPRRKGCKIVNTIEWADMMPQQRDSGRTMIDKANLLGYMSRCVAHGLLGRHPLSLKKIAPKPVVVKSLAMFKKMMKRMRRSDAIAVDTETGGLNVLKNKIATIQFANSVKKGYVVILDHLDSPFSAKELEYVKKDLQKFFMEKEDYKGKKTRYLIIQNGKFDLRIFRTVLKIPFIYWPVWDTLAGEFCLDENINYLSKMQTPAFNLAQIFARYDNDFYYTAEFSKGDRHTLGTKPLGKKELNYCSMDVQSIWGIHKMQMATASIMDFQGKSYLETYRRLMLVQMSTNIHQMSSMVVRGNDIDIQHLMHIASKNSPITKLMNEELKKLYEMPSVIKVNKKLAGSSGVPTKGLFGKAAIPWVFSLNTEAHKQHLYIKHLKLEPITVNPDSGKAKLDKWFQKKHENVPEIKILSRRNKLAILKNTFATGILRKASDDPDVRVDGRLRPDYGYEGVVSGRSNSFKPSLQQIPEHSAEAKIIKRMFITKKGTIHIKMDYSSHEVRGWGFISGDKQVAASFQEIIDLIMAFRTKPSDKTLKRMGEGGDIHKINYSMFTGVPVAKVTKEQRQSAKQIVFGSIYGMSAASLGEQLGISKEDAQALIDKFFKKAAKAAKWLEFTAAHAREKYYAFSPLGRRRNLYANMTGIRRIQSGCDRRAQNAPIQGMSSDFGFNAARLMERCIYEVFRKIGRPLDDLYMPSAGVMQMVHDSIKLEMEYKDFFIILWIVEYCAVYGLRKLIEEVFEFKLNVDFAIDVEVGATGDTFEKWDWRMGETVNDFDPKDTRYGMKTLIKKTLRTQREVLGHKVNVKRTMRRMYKEGRKHKKMLARMFPLPVAPI